MVVNEKKASLKKSYLLNTAYQVLTIITPFITAPYLSRVLGVEMIGINSYVHSLLYFFTMTAMLGTEMYGSREISRTRDDKLLNSKIFWEIEILSIFTSSIVLLGWIIFIIFFSGPYKIYTIILCLNILSQMFNINWYYTGQEKYKYTVGRNFAVKIITIILILSTVKRPEHLSRMMLINSLGGLLGNLTMWISLKKFLVPVKNEKLNVFRHLKETFAYFIPNVATSIYTVLDKTILGIMSDGTAENGFYEQAHKILDITKTLCFGSIAMVMRTRLTYLFEQNKKEEIKEKINTSMDFIMFTSIGACFGLAGISTIFIPFFYGSGYEKSIILMQLFCPTLIFSGVKVCVRNLYFVAAGLKKKTVIYELTGAIVDLVLNLILIPYYFSVGAVIGTIVAEFVLCVMYLIAGREYVSFIQFLKGNIGKLFAALVMFAVIRLLLPLNLNLSLSIKLFLLVVTGGLVYVFILFIIKDKTLSFVLNTIRGKIKKNPV